MPFRQPETRLNKSKKKVSHMGNQIIIIKNSNTWIEGNAVQQLETTAKLRGAVIPSARLFLASGIFTPR